MPMDLSAINGDTTDEVEVQQNTTGTLSPVFTVNPLEGRFVRINNSGGAGDGTGLPIYMDLRDANGNQLPVGTRVGLAYEDQTAETPDVVSQVKESIIPFRQYTISEQRQDDQVDQVKFHLDSRFYEVPYVDRFHVLVESGTAIDPAQSTIMFEETYLEEGPTGGI